MNEPADSNASAASALKRYSQLAVLVIAAGAIYPLIYLRQNFEVSILESFGITATELGQSYAMLGVIFVLTYVPSGWLADRVSPRLLVSFSLAATGLLGIWFSTMPSFPTLTIIFAGWGIATGLTFWSAMIKAVAVLGKREEQGRFFGILDGGRGLVEAILASIVVWLFAHWLQDLGDPTEVALRKVIWFYVIFMLALAPTVIFVIDDRRPEKADPKSNDINFWRDLKFILAKQEVWLSGFCILCGYQLFWATYSFSAYMQQNYGLTAVAVGTITVAKLWMRPIGAAAAGFAGDFLDREKVLAWLLVAGAVSLATMVALPTTAGTGMLLTVVLIVGLTTYAIRGIFWATLDSCNIPVRIKGLAIGTISLVGYSPDIYLPLINGPLLEAYPGKLGYSIYFSGIAFMGLIGALAAWRLKTVVASRDVSAA